MNCKGLSLSILNESTFDIVYVDKQTLVNMGITEQDIYSVCPNKHFFAISRDPKNNNRFNIVALESAKFIEQVTTEFPILKDDLDFKLAYKSKSVQDQFKLFNKSSPTKKQCLKVIIEDFEINLVQSGINTSEAPTTPSDISFKSL